MIGLTREADDALRIVYLLGKQGELIDTCTIAEQTAVPLRFALKILRKLSLEGIVTSQRGKSGGYRLAMAPNEITVRRIIELIDGPITLNRCTEHRYCCSRMGYNKTSCAYHRLFAAVGERLAQDLDRVTLQQILQDSDAVGDHNIG